MKKKSKAERKGILVILLLLAVVIAIAVTYTLSYPKIIVSSPDKKWKAYIIPIEGSLEGRPVGMAYCSSLLVYQGDFSGKIGKIVVINESAGETIHETLYPVRKQLPSALETLIWREYVYDFQDGYFWNSYDNVKLVITWNEAGKKHKTKINIIRGE